MEIIHDNMMSFTAADLVTRASVVNAAAASLS